MRQPPAPPKPTPAQRLARWRRLYAEAREIELRSKEPECQRAAREIALMALDLLAEERALHREPATPPRLRMEA